jgi:hypothetical protein
MVLLQVLNQCRELTSLMVTAKRQIDVSLTRGPPAINKGISQIVRAGFADAYSYMLRQDGRYYPALATVDNIRQQLSNAYDQPFLHRFRAWLPEVSNEVRRDGLSWVRPAVVRGALALKDCQVMCFVESRYKAGATRRRE